MELRICKDENEWVKTTNQWLKSRFAENPRRRRLFVPAGDTPRPLYRSWQSGESPLPADVRLVQLDEVLNGQQPFRQFFLDELPAFQSRFEFIDDAEQGADIGLLGLGLNGHVAFHEPSLPRSFCSGCMTLDSETCSRLKIPPRTRAISYGVGAFLRTQALALLVRGESKREVLARVLKRDGKYPASWLCEHPNLIVIADAAAAKK